MAEDNTENSNEGFARIEPASISLTTNSSHDNSTKSLTSSVIVVEAMAEEVMEEETIGESALWCGSNLTGFSLIDVF